MNIIEYKRAGGADIEILVNQRMLFARELGRSMPPDVEAMLRIQNTDYFAREINKSYISWYATINNEVVSIAGLHIRTLPGNLKNPSGIWGYVLTVYTMPEYRRKGLSKKVMERLMDTASTEYGVTAFELHATQDGEQLYINCGFEVHPEPTYRKFGLKQFS